MHLMHGWLMALLAAAPGLPVVAIDAGHGGAQHGATGVCGLLEKDVTRQLADRLAALLEASELATPTLLRRDDETLGLTERAERANEANAAVMVSIHANASPSPQPRGIETFFLSDRAAGGRLAHLAERENDGLSLQVQATRDPGLQRVLRGLTLDAAHNDSQAFALRVQDELSSRLHSRGRGVLQAPFMVLLSAQMAAVLVEVGFLTNPDECALLATVAHQEVIAEALATAVLTQLFAMQAPEARLAAP